LTRGRGSFAAAARQLGCTRSTIQNYCTRHPALYAVCVQARETLLDGAEDALHALIDKHDLGAVCFYLKTQGKARGYVERTEFSVHYDFSRLTDDELLTLGPIMAKLRGDAIDVPPVVHRALPVPIAPSGSITDA
jgi:hypothetical protein